MNECHDSGRCDRFYQALSDFLDGKLSEAERIAVEEHLRRCPPCEVYLEQFRQVVDATGRVCREKLPADFDRVMRGVMQAWKEARPENGPRKS